MMCLKKPSNNLITVRTTIYVSPLQQAIDKAFAQDSGVFFWANVGMTFLTGVVSPENHGTRAVPLDAR